MINFSFSWSLKSIVIIRLIAVLYLPLEAQTAGPLIVEHTNEDHGGGSISNSILEDRTGSIFIANEAGLLKYDGVSWLQMPTTAHASLVMSATIDAEDRIWLVGIGSVGYYESDDRGRYDYNDLTESIRALPESSAFGTFWEIRYFQECIFLVSSNYVLQRKNGEWRTWRFQDKRRILPSWHDDELYIHDRGKGLYRFSGDQFELIVSDTPEIASGIIGIVDHTEKGRLCATVSNGLFWLKDRKLTPFKSDIDKAIITHASKLKNGDLAIGTANQGLKILDKTGTLVHRVSINQNPIYNCLESSRGSIWVVGPGKIFEIKNRFLTLFNESTQGILKTNNQIY